MSDGADKDAANASREQAEHESRHRRLRALIIGTLAAGGAFQLNGWQVQANGNRSSHTAAGLRSSIIRPEDYTVFRLQMTSPNSRETLMLSLLATEGGEAAKIFENPLLKSLADAKAEMEQRLRVTDTTANVLNLIHSGDVAGAAATIEEQGVPEYVLDTYLWTLLDIAYLGSENGTFTDRTLGDFTIVAQQAVVYCKKALASIPANNPSPMDQALKQRVAEIFHNIASFTIPDSGVANSAGLALGLQAALDALRLREDIGQQQETMIANWMVGWQYRAANRLSDASQYLETSLQQAEALGDQAGIAWAKAALAKVARAQAAQPQLESASPQFLGRATALEADVAELRAGSHQNDLMMQFLALDNQLK